MSLILVQDISCCTIFNLILLQNNAIDLDSYPVNLFFLDK